MNVKYLNKINGPADVKNLAENQLPELADEMRRALIEKLSAHGGHSGPNLGFVEAAVALHHVFNSPYDKMVFDVSHQTYCHKMLTGRARAFYDPAHYDDVSGYSEPSESEHDLFTIGHTSTSVSLAAGLARARDLAGGKENVIAVIGDGSLSGGEALEGMDFAGEQNTNLIIVLNDNEMSIAENHGGLYKNLKLLRDTKGTAECNMFKAWGLDYIYVEDGNDVFALIDAFKKVKDTDRAVVVHIHTLKGKGLDFAEKDPENYHAGGPFDVKTGKYLYGGGGENYNSIVGDYLMKKIASDPAVVAVNAATPVVIGFSKEQREKAGRQFIDVGIAEENAAAMASGIAAYGGKPVWGVFSTFAQRTYDQVSQDICINNSPVTMMVFGASVNSMNDVTHLGIFDIPIFSNIPNLVYLAPTNAEELLAMTDWAVEQREHPVAIRVPVKVVHTAEPVEKDYSELNKYLTVRKGEKTAIIAVGSFFELGTALADAIEKETGTAPTLINPRYLTGIDSQLLDSLKENHSRVVTLEDGILDGGFGEKIARYYAHGDMKVYNYGLKKEFLDRYDPEKVMEDNRLTVPQIMADLD